jgi:peptidyl-prolyl cis-trans isomerase SurA
MTKINTTLCFLLLLFSWNRVEAQMRDIDKVIAIVGSEPILLSDLEGQYIQYLMQSGQATPDPAVRCDLFEELMVQKLLYLQALIDSVVVADRQVTARIDQKMNYYIMQIGSREQFEEYFGKTVDEFKVEFFEITREQMMIEQVQRGLTEDVKVTPTQVRRFLQEVPADSLPEVPAEYEIGQIVKKPPVRPEERENTISQLNSLRERIMDGEGFATLARLQSQDPGTAQKGGELTFGRGLMDPVFEATAFALKTPGEISEVIESSFGFHIIQLVRRSGDFVTVRHILKIPEVHPQDLLQAEKDLNNIKSLIEMDTLTFEEAAARFSDDPGGKNGGRLINPETGSSRFNRSEIDPAVAHTIERLKTGQVSNPVIMLTDDGKQAFRILYIYRKIDSHIINLEQDYEKIRTFALQQEKMQLMDQWIENKIKETYIKVLDDNLKGCDFDYDW